MSADRNIRLRAGMSRWAQEVSSAVGAGLVEAVDRGRDQLPPGARARSTAQGFIEELERQLGEEGDGPLARALEATTRKAVLEIARALRPSLFLLLGCVALGACVAFALCFCLLAALR